MNHWRQDKDGAAAAGGELLPPLQEEKAAMEAAANKTKMSLLDFMKIHPGRYLIREPSLSVNGARVATHLNMNIPDRYRKRSSVMDGFSGLGDRPLKSGRCVPKIF